MSPPNPPHLRPVTEAPPPSLPPEIPPQAPAPPAPPPGAPPAPAYPNYGAPYPAQYPGAYPGGYPPQGYAPQPYPPQAYAPQGYPGGYPAPYGGGYPGGYPQVMPTGFVPGYAPAYGYGMPQGPPRTAKPPVAAVFWGLILIRDIGFLFIVSIWWFEQSGLGFPIDFPFGLVDDPALMIGFCLIGMGAAVASLISALTRSHHLTGVFCCVIATAMCATPGILFGFGIVGVALGVIATVLHYFSRDEFKPDRRAGGAAVGGGPAPAR